jgi:nucleoside-diphosphate-sugar epimerase
VTVRSVLVTGAAGLLGRALLRELQRPREGSDLPREIRAFDLRPLERLQPGIVPIVGDVRSPDALRAACRGVDAVLHAAAAIDYGHAPEQLLYDVNVRGTQNVIAAAREHGVRALVYTSTMDVVIGSRGIRDGDESLPFPPRFLDAYARTKALAEQAALAANAPGLRTCALRPCGLYGEHDPYHVSSVLRAARAGRLLARIGSGRAVFQHVYVGNAAWGHVLALRKLMEPDAPAAGRVYFLTDFPATNFFDFMEPIATRLGHPFPPRWRRVPYPVALSLGTLLEGLARWLRPVIRFEPSLTRSSVRVLCRDLSFSGARAARELGYAPVYSAAEALERTITWFRENGPVDRPVVLEA